MRSLVRARWLVTAQADGAPNIVENGALAIENGLVLEVGKFDQLSERFSGATIEGTGADLVMPGFVNAHHHVGLTPLQLGSLDLPLELWVGSSRVDLQACKLEYSIVSPK